MASETYAELIELLTNKEQIVLDLIIDKGADNATIAAEMGIKQETVRHYVTSLMDKLRFHSRTEMAVLMLHKWYEKTNSYQSLKDAEYQRRSDDHKTSKN